MSRAGYPATAPKKRCRAYIRCMLIERLLRKRLSAGTGFIEPCLPSPAEKPPQGQTGFMRASTTATGSWPPRDLLASDCSPETRATGPSATPS
jgi:hypothetical protein